jgi:hypothetical protein
MRRIGFLLVAISTLAATAPALAEDVRSEDFVAACQSSSNLPESICACMADKLMTDAYTETQRQWLVMSLNEVEGADALVANMSPAEAVESAMFMVNEPRRCAAAG